MRWLLQLWPQLHLVLRLLLWAAAPPQAWAPATADGRPGLLDLALKFTLDLEGLSHQQEDTIIDALLLPRRSGVAAGGVGSAEQHEAFRTALIGVARRHAGVASAAATAEVIALLNAGLDPVAANVDDDVEVPSPLDTELTTALRQGELHRALALLESTRPLSEPAALAVDGEPALAQVLRREAERPILSRTKAAATTALRLCERGVDVSSPVRVDKEGLVPPLVLAARFRDAALCHCILTAQLQRPPDITVSPATTGVAALAAQALLELLDHGRNRGWSIAISRSLLLLPAAAGGGGERQAFRADVLQAALGSSAPLRRLYQLQ